MSSPARPPKGPQARDREPSRAPVGVGARQTRVIAGGHPNRVQDRVKGLATPLRDRFTSGITLVLPLIDPFPALQPLHQLIGRQLRDRTIAPSRAHEGLRAKFRRCQRRHSLIDPCTRAHRRLASSALGMPVRMAARERTHLRSAHLRIGHCPRTRETNQRVRPIGCRKLAPIVTHARSHSSSAGFLRRAAAGFDDFAFAFGSASVAFFAVDFDADFPEALSAPLGGDFSEDFGAAALADLGAFAGGSPTTGSAGVAGARAAGAGIAATGARSATGGATLASGAGMAGGGEPALVPATGDGDAGRAGTGGMLRGASGDRGAARGIAEGGVVGRPDPNVSGRGVGAGAGDGAPEALGAGDIGGWPPTGGRAAGAPIGGRAGGMPMGGRGAPGPGPPPIGREPPNPTPPMRPVPGGPDGAPLREPPKPPDPPGPPP